MGFVAPIACHITDICRIHTNDQVVLVIVGAIYLSCALRRKVDTETAKYLRRTAVNGIAEFLRRGRSGCGRNVRYPALSAHIAHYKFRHRTAADIAVADEQDFQHYRFPFKSGENCGFMRSYGAPRYVGMGARLLFSFTQIGKTWQNVAGKRSKSVVGRKGFTTKNYVPFDLFFRQFQIEIASKYSSTYTCYRYKTYTYCSY